MGIRGLTTFINNRSHLYLKPHELHDCNVVIDGNSLASNLYKWHCKGNDCFGGDYDKFAQVIRNFFDLLSQCNVNAYVILDGGYEKRKLNTVISRMKSKIWAAHSLSALTEGSESVFPLFLREVFVDIVVKLGIRVARCEFEGDMEIAGIAKTLGCPVISYDSDFYIFGCLYIPFSTVDLTTRKGKNKNATNPYTYLSCKIYYIENFLEAFGGLDRDNLPLLAVLLGNDYINGKMFKPFFRNLKMQKCSGNQSDQQKKIKSVIVWLQNEDIESAIKKVLSRFKSPRRQRVLKKIKRALKGYYEVNSELLKYLGIETGKQGDFQLDIDKLECTTEENNGDIEGDSSADESGSDVELDSDLEETSDTLSELFHKKFRSCQYHACFMDMITMNRYYCIPQIENNLSEHSHKISLDILNIIYKILTPNVIKRLNIVYRHRRAIRYSNLPRLNNTNFPTLEDIERFTAEERETVLLNALSIENKFSQLTKLFPSEWSLFLICLRYAVCKGQFNKPLICSCLICFIILQYVDPQIGFYRVSKTFDKKFASHLSEIRISYLKKEFDSFDKLPYDECVLCMDKTIAFFQMDLKLKTNHRLYDKVLVHSLSEIQSVFLHVKYLNSLLNNPFPVLAIDKIFDGTFLYNMTINLRKRTNISEYLSLFFKECPCILDGVNQVLSQLDDNLDCAKITAQQVKKHRKKKKKKNENNNEDTVSLSEDEEIDALIDPNNPYSLLAVM